MNPEELKEMFEHCEPGRWLAYFVAMNKLLRAGLADADFRVSSAALMDACQEGARLYMARIKGGFTDDE